MSGQNSLTSKEHSDYWKDKAKGPGLFDWIRDRIKPKTKLAGPKKPQEYSPAAEFAAEFQKDPREAYRKYGASKINSLMDEAISKGFLADDERTKTWKRKYAEDTQKLMTP